MSNAVSWVVSKQTGRKNVNYLDDFLFADRGEYRTNWQLDCFHAIAADIGFPVSLDKTRRAAQQQIFLGLLLDALRQIIGLPVDKIDKMIDIITGMLGKKRVTVKQLMSVAGHLNFLARAIVHGRPYIRCIYDCYTPISEHHNWHLKFPEEIKRDLRMWLQFLTLDQTLYRPFVDHLKTPAR